MSSERRRELRFCLAGRFDGFRFYTQHTELEPLPVDVSRSGLAVLIPPGFEEEHLQELHLTTEDIDASVTLKLRSSFRVAQEGQSVPQLRCGYELSEKDRQRGIDLLALVHNARHLKVRICS